MAQSYTWNSALSAEAEALQQHAEQQDRIWGYTNGGGPHTLTVNKLVDVLSCNLNMIYTTQIVRLDGKPPYSLYPWIYSCSLHQR